MTPRIEMAKYPESAAELFLLSLTCDGWYTKTPDWEWEETGGEETDTGKTDADTTPYRMAYLFSKWAAGFSISYSDGAVTYDFEGEGGKRKAWIKVPMEWEAWCGLFQQRYFDADCPLLYATYVPPFTYPKPGELPDTVVFKGGELEIEDCHGDVMLKKTPEEFVEDICKATEERWDLDFAHWIFITQDREGVIRKVKSLADLRSLLGDGEVKAHVRRIREGKNEPASQQIEVKIGEGLYGVADYQPENLTFLTACLGFKGIPSLHYAGFDLPLPIINCIVY